MITLVRTHTGWAAAIDLRGTVAADYATCGTANDSPHVRGKGEDPHLALHDAIFELGASLLKEASVAKAVR